MASGISPERGRDDSRHAIKEPPTRPTLGVGSHAARIA